MRRVTAPLVPQPQEVPSVVASAPSPRYAAAVEHARAPVTPATRFNIGTAASAVIPAVAPLGLTDTGADAAKEWSPGHVGEPEEAFPLFTIVRHVIWQPLGLTPAKYPLAGGRATFYVPTSEDSDPRHGRRLMYMRDLARAGTPPGSIDGELAGGMVMSLVTERDGGLVIAVTSNIAHANTASLAQRVGDAFAELA